MGNNPKIKGKIAEEIKKQLNVTDENKPTYIAITKHIKQKYGVQLSPQRISCWWREQAQEKQTQQKTQPDAKQRDLPIESVEQTQNTTKTNEQPEKEDSAYQQAEEKTDSEAEQNQQRKQNKKTNVTAQWQANNIAGSFILYAMLKASQFRTPFTKNLKGLTTASNKSIERIMLTLFCMHALRLKSLEQSKHLIATHFAPLVLGAFCRVQNLRYAIDDITGHENFDSSITEHYQNISQYTDLGDENYYKKTSATRKKHRLLTQPPII